MPGEQAPKRFTCDGNEWEVRESGGGAAFSVGSPSGGPVPTQRSPRSLIFRSVRSPTATRDLSPVPAGWDSFTDEELCRHLARAKPVS